MKKNIEVINNQIKIRAPKRAISLITIAGIFVISIGVYLYLSAGTYSHIFIGIGLVLLFGGLVFFIGSHYYKIVIDKQNGYIDILESSYKVINPVRIPLSYYTSIIIQRKLSENKSASSPFEIHLMSDFGSTLFISQVSDLNEAVETGKELQDLLNIDLVMEEDAYKKILNKKIRKAERINLEMPEKTSIKKIVEGNHTVLAWKNKRNNLHYLFLMGAVYGFFHLIWFVLKEETGSGLPLSVLCGIIAFINLLIFFSLIYNLLGTNFLKIIPDGITCYSKIFGKKFKLRQMSKSEIGMVRNSINESDNNIKIISRNGIDIIKKIATSISQSNDSSIDLSMISLIMSLKDEIIEIYTPSLTMEDKIFIEDKILSIM